MKDSGTPPLRIALVKQDIYQDLYVCPPDAPPLQVLESTLMRTGPIGLFTHGLAQFLIVKEDLARECQVYRRVHDVSPDLKMALRGTRAKEIKQEYFRFLEPLSPYSHSDFSVAVDQIDWSMYDVVISINIAVPSRIVRQHPAVLWCYMFGEAGWDSPVPDFGYDVCLTQNTFGTVASKLGNVDFPYTFLGPRCLEDLMSQYHRVPWQKSGVYAEINCTQERPVVSVPQLEPLKQKGLEIRLHSQNILENLTRVCRSLFFVKWGGRSIRGNSVIEAISCGTLVLMDPRELVHSQLLPPETWIRSFEDLESKIDWLSHDLDAYKRLLDQQRALLDQFVFRAPLESLANCLQQKRQGAVVEQYSFGKRLKAWLKRRLLY